MAASLLLLGLSAAIQADISSAFSFRDGDRVAIVGGTWIEREQRHGYWETAWTVLHPQAKVKFRNLGWSGDTVWGDSRAGFETRKEGFARLIGQVMAFKPTVILIGYGGNEAFAGKSGLPAFRDGLTRLLEAVAPTRARIVLLAPLNMENQGPPYPDPAQYNASLQEYKAVLKQTAIDHKWDYVDLQQDLKVHPSVKFLTDNNLHLSQEGYWNTMLAWAKPPAAWEQIEQLEAPNIPRVIERSFLPLPSIKTSKGQATEPTVLTRIRCTKLSPGKLTLLVDGRRVATADANEWKSNNGVAIVAGPEMAQVEQLRQAIIEKNQVFFYRWRPQNETYLFGFRKHEQGNNASEVLRFDALVSGLEERIDVLKKPIKHTYELVSEQER